MNLPATYSPLPIDVEVEAPAKVSGVPTTPLVIAQNTTMKSHKKKLHSAATARLGYNSINITLPLNA